MTRDGEVEALRWAQEEPVVFIGQPHMLTGQLRVTNPGDSRAVLREARIWLSEDDQAGTEPIAFRVRATSVRAKETRTIPIRLGMDLHTPPGDYRAQLEIGNEQREVTVHVLEHLSLSITPSRVLIPNSSGEKFSTRVFVSNAGNVPLTVDEIGAVPLEDELLNCRIARRALDGFEPAGNTYQDFLTEVVRQAKVIVSETGPLVVQNKSGVTTLNPGEAAPLELDIRLPADIDRRGRYIGTALLYDTQLTFAVAPGQRHSTVPRKSTRQVSTGRRRSKGPAV
jgi:hypothetical protein